MPKSEVVNSKYRYFTWPNLMNMFAEAIKAGSGEGYFKKDKDIHKVEVVYNDDNTYEVTVNDLIVGDAEDIGDMWDIVEDNIILGEQA